MVKLQEEVIKGQKARSGGGVRPGFEGGQMPLYRRILREGIWEGQILRKSRRNKRFNARDLKKEQL